MAQALQYCHSNGIMHRDIKLENILVSVDDDGKIYDVKLADFGKAIKFSVDDAGISQKFRHICGTTGYLAPEMLRLKQPEMKTIKDQNYCTGYDYRIDIWALGIVLYTMIAGGLPFYDDDSDKENMKSLMSEPSYKDDGWFYCAKSA